MLNLAHLRVEVIRPVIKSLNLWSPAAENLVLGTVVQESVRSDGRVQHLVQLGGGPALGICQMEPATHDWLVDDWLKNRHQFRAALAEWTVSGSANEMVWNTAYAVAMCRLRYYVDSKPLPAANDLPALAQYWKRVYNTHLGAGKPIEFMLKYQNLVGIPE